MATRVYKLTTQANETHNRTLWGSNVAHKAPGTGPLCSSGWLHAYTDPLLAVLLNPIHAAITEPKLWLTYGSGARLDDDGLKVGFSCLKTVKELPLPVVTPTQRIAFAILCALEVYKDSSFAQWANDWLSGKDRSVDAANAAYAAANAAAYTAANAAAYTAANAAAYTAANAAYAAANAAAYAAANAAAYTAANAARAAANAARAAANAAARAAVAKPLDLRKIARQAMKVK